MSVGLQPPRGTADILGDEGKRFSRVEEAAARAARAARFEILRTPVFEPSALFKRGLGETSDVVSKEMYEFQDRGGEALTLRPEFTAGAARAFVNAGLHHHKPVRFYSFGPLFRYERPQKGRRRQFHQANFEAFGPASPLLDAEIIGLAYRLLQELGVADTTRTEINSLGDSESRAAYRAALLAYLSRYKDELSEDSKRRLELNPLRVLDSKDETDKKICAGAPAPEPYRTPAAAAFFERVQEGLTVLGVPFTVNPALVRGLDYYCHTAFECVSEDPEAGAQSTVAAGGRYDGLIEQLGGEPTPAFGFAAGAERIARLLPPLPEERSGVAVLPAEDSAELFCLKAAAVLRARGIAAEPYFDGALRKRLKTVDKKGARYLLVIGGQEMAEGIATVRDLAGGAETRVTLHFEQTELSDLLALFAE